MALKGTVGRRVMAIIIRTPGCQIEEVVRQCPDLTWNQVFFELDRLSRSGEVVLRQKSPGVYAVTLRAKAGMATASTSTH